MEAGIFNSPDYPFHTGSSLNCEWTFRVRPGYGILFNLTEFTTSQFADWITVRFISNVLFIIISISVFYKQFYEEGSPGTSYLMDAGGLNGQPFHLTTRTSVARVRFSSGAYIARKWKATFHEYEGNNFGQNILYYPFASS